MASDMKIEIDARETTTVIFLAGDLDWAGAARLTACVDRLSSGQRTQAVIIDMSGLEFTDSSGLDAIAHCQKQCRTSGISFAIQNPRPLVERMLVATGDAARLTIVGARPASGGARDDA